jgi:hypothetical protein
MQSHGWACAESPKGISGGLQGGRVVQNDAQPVAIVKKKVLSSRKTYSKAQRKAGRNQVA